MKTYKKRTSYLDKIRPYIGRDIIKVLIGQRRVGKSYILMQIQDELRDILHVPAAAIIYINKELYEYDYIHDYHDLIQYIQERTLPDVQMYICIDEIQDILSFEKALRHLQASRNYDIYISGSNATMLSSEISTYLTGRYIEFEIFPLSYSEFLDFHDMIDSTDAFTLYMQYGGLPYLHHVDLSPEIGYDYLQSVYSTIVLRDIIQRYAIRNTLFLAKLMQYIADNIGSIFTANNISKYLKSQKVDIGTNVVIEYIQLVVNVYLVHRVQRQEIVGKKIFEVNDKYYFTDIGIRNAILGGYRHSDISKILENIVYLHFRREGYTIYIGKNKDKEIDFVVEKLGIRKYIQVCYLLESPETHEREFGNLLDIHDNYEKIVLSLDEHIVGDYMGIHHYNIRKYLTKISG